MGRGLSLGEAGVTSRCPLPEAFPEGAPLDNVGTKRAHQCGGCGPNIVKDGTPQRGKRGHPADRPEPVPGTRSNAQEWLIDSSHRVPGAAKGVDIDLEYSIILI
jgi:hypothetical protein